MLDADEEFMKMLEKTNYAAKLEESNALAIAENMMNMGLPFETIVSATMLDSEKVRCLYTAPQI